MKHIPINHAALISALVLLSSTALADQGGCVNSPENPTLLLALATAGIAGVRHWRKRAADRRAADAETHQ